MANATIHVARVTTIGAAAVVSQFGMWQFATQGGALPLHAPPAHDRPDWIHRYVVHLGTTTGQAQTPFANPEISIDVVPTTALDSGTPATLLAILDSLDGEAVEDGVTHTSERLVAELFQTPTGKAVGDFVVRMIEMHDRRSAGFLQLLGRSGALDTEARKRLLIQGLRSASIETRDAAVQAFELWDDESLRPLLEAHREDTPWLAQYIERLLRQPSA